MLCFLANITLYPSREPYMTIWMQLILYLQDLQKMTSRFRQPYIYDSKIRIIIKMLITVKIAQVDEFWCKPMPNESSWIKFYNFSVTLNLQWFMLVAQHFGHRPYPEFWNDGLYIMLYPVTAFLLKTLILFQIWKSNLYQLAENYNLFRQIFYTRYRS